MCDIRPSSVQPYIIGLNGTMALLGVDSLFHLCTVHSWDQKSTPSTAIVPVKPAKSEIKPVVLLFAVNQGVLDKSTKLQAFAGPNASPFAGNKVFQVRQV